MSFVVFFVQRTGEEAKLAGSKAGVVFNQVSCILVLKLGAYTTGFLLKKQKTNYRMGSAAFHGTQFCLEKLAVNKEKAFYHDHFFLNYA